MIIDVTGFGWSGSGAVHDLLREYDDVYFPFSGDWEFTLLWMVDGIADLEHKLCVKHCRYGDSDMAIRRFLRLVKALDIRYKGIFEGEFYNMSEKYIHDLTQVEFRAGNFEELLFPSFRGKILKVLTRLFLNKYLRKLTPLFIKEWLKMSNTHRIRLSYNPDDFILRTCQFMDDILKFIRVADRNNSFVTDQLFPPDDPRPYFKYLKEPVKSIIVRRDPRDTYLLAKCAYSNDAIPIPTKTVEDFILFYKKTIEDTKINDDAQILNLRFEDVIYQYNQTVGKIEKFLGITCHARPKSSFNPAISVNNTQLYKKYRGFEEDIRKIEEALPNSLYPFESAPKVEAINSLVY